MKRLFSTAALFAAISLAPAQNITTEELEKHLEDRNVFFLDVREPEEIKKLGSVPGYVNIPVGQLEKRLDEVPKDKLIVTLWNKGGRAARAADILKKNGFKTLGSCGLADYKEKGKKLVYPEDDKDKSDKTGSEPRP